MITRSQLMAAKEAAGEVTLRQKRANDHSHPATTEADWWRLWLCQCAHWHSHFFVFTL